jgi:hypothetical protein
MQKVEKQAQEARNEIIAHQCTDQSLHVLEQLRPYEGSTHALWQLGPVKPSRHSLHVMLEVQVNWVRQFTPH